MLLNGLLQKKLPVLHIPVISILFDVTSRNDSWQKCQCLTVNVLNVRFELSSSLHGANAISLCIVKTIVVLA